jgi:FkbM family methyltransferase
MRDGFFVEFGAQDGVSFSNTLLLEREFGWRGILAEANPRFRDHIGANRTAQTCGKCIYSETGRSIEFWDIPAYPGLSTSAEHASGDQYASQRGEAPNRVVVETISLNDLLTNFEAPPTIDYMSVDTEGSELEILAAFDFSKWQVRFMGIEYNTPEREIQLDAFMESLGYQRAFRQLSPVDGLYRRLPTPD